MIVIAPRMRTRERDIENECTATKPTGELAPSATAPFKSRTDGVGLNCGGSHGSVLALILTWNMKKHAPVPHPTYEI